MAKKKAVKSKAETPAKNNEIDKRKAELQALIAAVDKGEEILGIAINAEGKTIEVKRGHITGISINAKELTFLVRLANSWQLFTGQHMNYTLSTNYAFHNYLTG